MAPVQVSSAPGAAPFRAMIPLRVDHQTVRSVSLNACRSAGIPDGRAQLQADLLLDAMAARPVPRRTLSTFNGKLRTSSPSNCQNVGRP